jgi:basic membrane protein A
VLDVPAAVPAGQDPRSWQPHILTSVTKRLDLALHAALADYAAGGLAPGTRSLGLAESGVDITYSGGFLDDIRPEIEAVRSRIISGVIDVPTTPADPLPTEAP